MRLHTAKTNKYKISLLLEIITCCPSQQQKKSEIGDTATCDIPENNNKKTKQTFVAEHILKNSAEEMRSKFYSIWFWLRFFFRNVFFDNTGRQLLFNVFMSDGKLLLRVCFSFRCLYFKTLKQTKFCLELQQTAGVLV